MSESFVSLWEAEYKRRGIPSSFRDRATKHVVEFASFLETKGLTSRKALDLGSGKGRNALFLAERGFQITCLDLVPENVIQLQKTAHERTLSLKSYERNLSVPWNLAEERFDVALDIFCYKHIVRKEGQAVYREELASYLKPGGFFLLNLAADDDGFYGPLLKTSKDPSIKYIEDPHSQIPSLLYSLDEIREEFSPFMRVIEAKKVHSIGPMYGKEYHRSVLSIIFQRR